MSREAMISKSTSEEAREVGKALKHLRERCGLTQDRAAEILGVTRTAWQNYEAGRAIVLRTDMQARLAKALGATREDLIAILRDLQNVGASHSSAGVAEPGAMFTGPGRQQAIFPTSEGDVILNFPVGLSPSAQDEMAAYLELFLRTRSRAVGDS